MRRLSLKPVSNQSRWSAIGMKKNNKNEPSRCRNKTIVPPDEYRWFEGLMYETYIKYQSGDKHVYTR